MFGSAQKSEYQKRQDGNATVFEVTPGTAPKFTIMAIGGAVLALLGLFMLPFGIIFIAGGAFAIWFSWFREMRPKGHAERNTFRVTPEAIDGGGRTFKKDEIHRLIIKNALNNEIVTAPNVMIPINAPTAMGVAFRAQVATVANGLEVETGGKAYLLAGGMDQTTAFGLMHDVSKVIGFAAA
ncbi:MAG TPA: hypothetical protein VEU47_09050 [Candidatus Cybelea sp.]|nr:hypothetical protein [Candidatus Cybelea sp.]